MGERTLAFRIDEELHRQLKIELAQRGSTLKDYVIGLIKSDLYERKSPISVEELRKQAQQINAASLTIIEMTNKK